MVKLFNCIEVCDKKIEWINDSSSGQYSVNKKIRHKAMLR